MQNKIILSLKELQINTKTQKLFGPVNLDLFLGECRGICAPTGSGKTTLFNTIAGIINQSEFIVNGTLKKAPDLKICYAFQEPRLISSVKILKNVMLPLENLMPQEQAQTLAACWLDKLKLEQKSQSFPAVLSGGEQQRAGLARAFAWNEACAQKGEPCLLLLDEPFASQDEKNAFIIENLIKSQVNTAELNTSALVISHDRQILEKICTNFIQII